MTTPCLSYGLSTVRVYLYSSALWTDLVLFGETMMTYRYKRTATIQQMTRLKTCGPLILQKHTSSIGKRSNQYVGLENSCGNVINIYLYFFSGELQHKKGGIKSRFHTRFEWQTFLYKSQMLESTSSSSSPHNKKFSSK